MELSRIYFIAARDIYRSFGFILSSAVSLSREFEINVCSKFYSRPGLLLAHSSRVNLLYAYSYVIIALFAWVTPVVDAIECTYKILLIVAIKYGLCCVFHFYWPLLWWRYSLVWLFLRVSIYVFFLSIIFYDCNALDKFIRSEKCLHARNINSTLLTTEELYSIK